MAVESSEHLAGRIMRERHWLERRLMLRGTKVTDSGYDFTCNVGEFVYELPTGERFEVQIRAYSEVTDGS